jgi:hypothetical protein
MDFSITKYSIFWDMRVINWYQENLCSCCNREWKIFDVEETCLVMCAIYIGIHRWNSIIIINVGADRRNLMNITNISLYFPTLPYLLFISVPFYLCSTVLVLFGHTLAVAAICFTVITACWLFISVGLCMVCWIVLMISGMQLSYTSGRFKFY